MSFTTAGCLFKASSIVVLPLCPALRSIAWRATMERDLTFFNFSCVRPLSGKNDTLRGGLLTFLTLVLTLRVNSSESAYEVEEKDNTSSSYRETAKGSDKGTRKNQKAETMKHAYAIQFRLEENLYIDCMSFEFIPDLSVEYCLLIQRRDPAVPNQISKVGEMNASFFVFFSWLSLSGGGCGEGKEEHYHFEFGRTQKLPTKYGKNNQQPFSLAERTKNAHKQARKNRDRSIKTDDRMHKASAKMFWDKIKNDLWDGNYGTYPHLPSFGRRSRMRDRRCHHARRDRTFEEIGNANITSCLINNHPAIQNSNNIRDDCVRRPSFCRIVVPFDPASLSSQSRCNVSIGNRVNYLCAMRPFATLGCKIDATTTDSLNQRTSFERESLWIADRCTVEGGDIRYVCGSRDGRGLRMPF
ncbi:hypothetical protein BC835DRAFT_1447609 [Cytidiella melzeri]|nr:hypothetical protein BC835DRAFT_1447609 [Cytidiella melzeri]